MARAAVGEHENTGDAAPLVNATIGEVTASINKGKYQCAGTWHTGTGQCWFSLVNQKVETGKTYDLVIQKNW